MDAMARGDESRREDDFAPFERIDGALDGGVLVVCDHAANALPPRYGALGLPREALERHIAYDIGAAWLTRRLAERLGAPAVLSTFSRLLIDPNRGADDPTLVMRFSDGAIVPGNARSTRRKSSAAAPFWAPYRAAIAARSRRCWRPASRRRSSRSIPSRRSGAGPARPWKVGVLWDPTRACRAPLLAALAREGDLGPDEIGDNEPYAGALAGDTIDSVATPRGLSNALIEFGRT